MIRSDRRVHRLFLTAAGERAMAKHRGDRPGIGGGAARHSLTREERTQLRQLLERLVADQDITPGVHPGYRHDEAPKAR